MALALATKRSISKDRSGAKGVMIGTNNSILRVVMKIFSLGGF
jgi:hypothetical protein